MYIAPTMPPKNIYEARNKVFFRTPVHVCVSESMSDSFGGCGERKRERESCGCGRYGGCGICGEREREREREREGVVVMAGVVGVACVVRYTYLYISMF